MKKVFQIYDSLEEKFLVATLAVSVAVIFLQVIMRRVFNNSLSWTEELARYLYIWQGWLGISLVERHRTHIAIDILKNKLHGTAKKVLNLFVQVICLFAAGFMAWFGFQMVAFAANAGTASVALRLPLNVIYAAMPVGCTMYCIRVLIHLVEDLGIAHTETKEATQ